MVSYPRFRITAPVLFFSSSLLLMSIVIAVFTAPTEHHTKVLMNEGTPSTQSDIQASHPTLDLDRFEDGLCKSHLFVMIYFSHHESLSSRFEPFVSKPFSRGKYRRDCPSSSAQDSAFSFRSVFFFQRIAFYLPKLYTNTKVLVTTVPPSQRYLRLALSLIHGIELTFWYK